MTIWKTTNLKKDKFLKGASWESAILERKNLKRAVRKIKTENGQSWKDEYEEGQSGKEQI